jgi:hypothetical protein
MPRTRTQTPPLNQPATCISLLPLSCRLGWFRTTKNFHSLNEIFFVHSSGKGSMMRAPTSPAFAESTISAVQAALHKHQLQAHELHVLFLILMVEKFADKF